MWILRLLTFADVRANRDHADLPEVFRGTRDQCAEYAESLGYEWRDSRKLIFGGYYHLPMAKDGEHEGGSCLMPDTV